MDMFDSGLFCFNQKKGRVVFQCFTQPTLAVGERQAASVGS